MPRIESRLAARIDRLSRAAHRFHRFAHHPLCDEYKGELVRLGKRSRVCRGCLFVALGVSTGLAASFCFSAPWPLLLFSVVVGIAAALVGTMARRSNGRSLAPKVATRFLPALAIVQAMGSAVQHGLLGWMIAAVSAVPLFAVVTIYRRRGPDRTPCASCAERNLATPCRGLGPIVRRERAFRRLAGQWLARANP